MILGGATTANPTEASMKQDTKELFAAAPVDLGPATGGPGAGCGILHLGGGRLEVLWIDASGRIVQSAGSLDKGGWTRPVPMAQATSGGIYRTLHLTGDPRTGWQLTAQQSDDPRAMRRVWRRSSAGADWVPAGELPGEQPGMAHGLPSGGLVAAPFRGGRIALRAGRRVEGAPASFPSAGLVVAVETSAGWHDVGFADDTPDAPVDAAALAVDGAKLAAVYIASDLEGQRVCRVIRAEVPAENAVRADWRKLPDYPQKPGMAGILAGVHDDVLMVAGGANFPDRPLWEGGKKTTYDEIYVLLPGETTWRPAGRLPEPRAYAAVVSLPGGVLVAGGENAEKVFQDTMLMRWDGGKVVFEKTPDLPAPRTGSVAVLCEGSVYLAGGAAPGSPRTSCDDFWRLDLAESHRGWQRLPKWSGPSRTQGVMSAVNGAVYLISGLEVSADPEGKPRTTYLRDAHRYSKGKWARLPDLPWSAVAAPSPAPVTASPARVFVLGGVDGRQSGKVPRESRLPDDILYFEVAENRWKLWPGIWPDPVVTSPTLKSGAEWIIPSGEITPCVRTLNTWAWRLEDRADLLELKP